MMAASSARRAVRLGYLVSHPVQYQAPLLRRLAQQTEVDFKVYFLSGMSTGQYFDTGFGRPIEWDVPLLDGYKHEFLSPSGENVEPSRLRNLAVEKVLARDRVEVLWQHGWGYFTNLRASCRLSRRGTRRRPRQCITFLGKEPTIPPRIQGSNPSCRPSRSRID